MDALRKAEREKREAAEKLQEKQQSKSQKDPASKGLSLSLSDDYGKDSPVSDREDETPNPAGLADSDATLANPSAADRDLSPSDGEISGNNTGTGSRLRGAEQEADKEAAQAPSKEGGEITASGHGEKFTIDMTGEAMDQTLISGGDKEEDDTLIIEKHNHGNELQDSATLSETLEQTRTHNGNPDKGPAREYAKSGDSGYTPVSAQHVFAAKRRSSYTAITVSILVLLVVIGFFAYGVFYYFSVTPINRDMPSPTVAQGVEATEALPVHSEPEVDVVRPPIDIEPPQLSPDTAVAGQTVSDLFAALPGPATEDGSIAPSETGKAIQAEPERSEPVKPAPESRESDSTSTAMAEIELRPELLQISRNNEPARESQALVDAYHAFRSGDLPTARTLYRSVLEQEQENQDALLGLAAIAVREQRYDRAYDYYSAVLSLNPADPNAMAALINLQQQADPAVSESRIRQLLERYPDSAYLHYVLGNVYSKQKRWPNAQQAYFNAHSLDSENPDYALNLAVSLDHMSKYEAALDYYKKSLNLANSKEAGFNASAVQNRIGELSR